MRLLIITQKVDINDDILGFFHSWLFEFSKKCEAIIALCLERGQYDLPTSVKVLSLGKEGGKSRVKYLINFYKHIWQERKNYDAVFVHMNPIYIVLGGVFWNLAKKKIILWYTHRQVDMKLWLADKFADFILTASEESLRLSTKKMKVLGHGIDVEKFRAPQKEAATGLFKIIYVGRIAKIKNQEILIKAADYLINIKNIKDFQIDFVGSPIYEEDRKLLAVLKKMIEERKIGDYVYFYGSVPNKDIVEIYQQADLTINLCPTGGLDKAVLESLACGAPAVVFNKGFQETFGKYKKELILANLDEKELGDKILSVKNWDWQKRNFVGRELRDAIIQKHSLKNLIEKISKYFNF